MANAKPGPVRADIQGLRALAVGGVIADHLLHWPRGGFVGVDVFFVISGFLITGLLMREFERRGSISFTHFYVRRIKRILPAALFVLFATTAVSYALLGASRFASLAKDVAWSALFGGNWRFAAVGVDYFEQSRPTSPVQHYWSLAVEEQFYVVWPWLMLGLLLLGMHTRWWGAGHARLVAGSAIGLLSIMSLVWAVVQTQTNPTYAYFSTLTRVWELGVGAAVALAARPVSRQLRRTPAARRLMAWAGLGGIGVAYLVVPASNFPAPWGLLPVLSTAAVLAAGLVPGAPQPVVLTNRVAGYLGDISYSLYLWHFPVIILLLTVMVGGTTKFQLVAAALILVLSVASFHLLEQPARNREWIRRSGRRVAVPAAGWVAVALACILVVAGSAALRDTVQAGEESARAGPSRCLGAAALDPARSCPLNAPGFLAISPSEAADDTDDAYDCYAARGALMKPCSFGPTTADARRVAVVGDSHAAALLPALWPQLDKVGWRVTAFVGRNCGWASAPGTCTSNSLRHKALTSGQFDLVIAVSRRQPATALHSDVLAARMRATIASGTKVVVVEDNPHVPAELLECVYRVGFGPDRTCDMSRAVAYGDGVDELVRVAHTVKGVGIVPTRDLYCTPQRCPALVGNVLVYRDAGAHVTPAYQRTVAPYLVERVRDAGGME